VNRAQCGNRSEERDLYGSGREALELDLMKPVGGVFFSVGMQVSMNTLDYMEAEPGSFNPAK
jgi:hypothetical protein